jgi:hypothetical protein
MRRDDPVIMRRPKDTPEVVGAFGPFGPCRLHHAKQASRFSTPPGITSQES